MKTDRDVVVVGRACRLPGASNVGELWENLRNGVCSVSTIPETRWSHERFGHPRRREPGRSYVWAAGVIDDVWGFDPAVFGLSPREVEQMDPQQRIMLELTWEALEDGGIRPSDIAGTEVGVFVGASSAEYSNIRNADVASADGYSATGGALSIISNRISYAFDLRGPSFTVDTACSSSLVALNQAFGALKAGTIDTAIVGGVNVLLSPYGFVLFSAASMLSPEGLCRAFDARAEGYVRAEGGVVLVLQTAKRAARDRSPVHGRIVASGVNSDGRTNGIALPSRDAQRKLLDDVYRDAGIRPDDLAFVEAHGTGTRVGDPIEASSIGEILGRTRSTPLMIGSIKSNIGHLEPGSGLAGVLKTLLALEHDLLPPSVNFEVPNPDIDFTDLNLVVCDSPTAIPRRSTARFAGVNSFGFGGTNAHVIVGEAPARAAPQSKTPHASDLFILSAATDAALRDVARRYAERLGAADGFEDAREIVAAAAHQRDLLGERAVISWSSPRDLIRKLERIADREADIPEVVRGSVTEARAPTAFVFSGNGSQWPGMGRESYRTNRVFRESFDEIDAIFDARFGWSVTEALFAEDLSERLRFTHLAQPLIFAIQFSVARALRAAGLQPFCVIGHSVGEIAAAAAAGALTLNEAVLVIEARSRHQELARDLGRMAVVAAPREQVEALCAEIGDVTIAAENASRAFTVAGPTEAIARLGRLAHSRRIVFRQLDLDYPFHCRLVDPVRDPLLRDLAAVGRERPRVPMISTVTGEGVDGPLDATYWWRNIREPVRFATAVAKAAEMGARVFVEIGPRSILLSNLKDILGTAGVASAAIGVLEKQDESDAAGDQIRRAVLSAVTHGADVSLEILFGPRPQRMVPLPTYPWARRSFLPTETGESHGSTLRTEWHALLGARVSPTAPEWSRVLDSMVLPELADHKVGGQAILPGSAFIEIALAAARSWLECPTPELREFDILQPLPIDHDRSRELKVRVSPATGGLEILGRPRLTQGGWTTHAVGQITRGHEGTARERSLLGDDGLDASAIYAAAEAVGLRYGPAFRLLHRVGRLGERRLSVELEAAGEADSRYGVDPARLDACFHGLFALFGELGANARGMAYVPVRVGKAFIGSNGAVLAGCEIEIVRAGPGSILADFILFDEAGREIGHLLDVRFQAARVERSVRLADKAIATRTTALDVGARGLPGLVRDLPLLDEAASAWAAPDDDARPADLALMDAWASATALRLATTLSDNGALRTERVGSLPGAERAWMLTLLEQLGSAGLADATDDGWTLAGPDSLPEPEAIFATLAADHPERANELLLAARAATWSPGGDASGEPWIARAAQDAYELGAIAVRGAGHVVADILARSRLLHENAGLRVLQVGFGPLSFELQSLIRDTDARLTLFDPDERRLERAKLALNKGLVAFEKDADTLPASDFDVILSAEGLHRFVRSGGRLEALRAALAPGGVLLAVEPHPSLFRDVALGLTADWFGEGGGRSHGPVAPGSEWLRDLEAASFTDVSSTSIHSPAEEATLILARAKDQAADATIDGQAAPSPVVVRTGRTSSGRGLSERLAAHFGTDVIRRQPGDDPAALAPGTPVVFVPTLASRKRVASADALRSAILDLVSVASLCSRPRGELWLVLPQDGTSSDGVRSGLAAFSRTLANEQNGLRVHRITVQPGLDEERAASGIANLLRRPQTETDILLTSDGPRALRFDRLPAVSGAGAAPPDAHEILRLERGAAGGLSGLHWARMDRPPLSGGEVEIAVDATGLNFRDVMWGMSLLPDDILEDGFAGPTLGLECAGTVTRTATDAARFRVGDRVLAFAPSAFSMAVTVPEDVVMPVPAHWSTEAAAGVPVAFLTAYYGLITLGRLSERDWVLIHGAAGGVGLAAIQIAQWRGATIVATAGSPEKCDLLRALGVEHIFDSRSTSFADDLRALKRDGVDVVLNSLAGEAMERSIATLRPFGRFIELGKRDYVANTRIGLRPFKRNLSYFGVDVDQLLSDRERAAEIFGQLMTLFADGELSPLPYRVFGGDETLDAFRLMQQSGHIGKILVRPAAVAPVNRATAPFRFDPERTHVVTGGLGGFGMETARWLADQGVRHLALLGRSGATSEEAKALVAELAARGVQVATPACDVADTDALAGVLDEIGRTMPPIAGIVHGAMVLEDGLIATLTEEALARVIGPKVAGADNLDRVTATMDLDYFVLFSSITTVIGNPGQGAYVAANGYLEGLARRRREQGRPGLALAWGAISDVGILARKKGLADVLAKRAGVIGMPARDALRLMAEALAMRDDAPPVMAVGTLDWGAAKRLPALASPTYEALTRGVEAGDGGEKEAIDLRALIAAGPPEAVRKRVADVILEEIALVLRVPRQDINPTKRLGELGLDSLMAIELAGALQGRLGLDDPPSGSVGAMSTLTLADQLIALAATGPVADDHARAAISLNERHGAGELASVVLGPKALTIVKEKTRDLKGVLH